MKRSIFGAAALALVLSASAAQAQRPMSFGVALGASMPTGDAGEFLKTGYHVMGTLGFSPPALPVGVRIDGTLNQFSGKTISTPFGPIDAGDFRILSLTANATFGMPMAASPISPYLIGGLGMYNGSSPDAEDDPATSEDESKGETKLGFNIGVGTKFALAGFGTFAELRYHMIPDGAVNIDTGKKSSFNFIPISFGITF